MTQAIQTQAALPKLKQHDLMYFTGTETWTRHNMCTDYTYTEGVTHVAEAGGAYWLIDDIFLYHDSVDCLKAEPFCVFELKKHPDGRGATLTCTDGNLNELYQKRYVFTDFPLDSIKFYLTDNVLMLTSEY